MSLKNYRLFEYKICINLKDDNTGKKTKKSVLKSSRFLKNEKRAPYQ